MSSLPLGAARYFRSAIFSSVPRGQKRNHRLRSDVWSRIHVLDGALALIAADSGQSRRRGLPEPDQIVHAGELLDVEPGILHHLEPVGDDVRFVVHLYRVPPRDLSRNELARWENEGGRAQS